MVLSKGLNEMVIEQMNGAMLAFVGDAYYELKVREFLIKRGVNKTNRFHKLSVFYVSAKAQARLLEWLNDQELLTEEELVVVKRGRNVKTGTVPKNTDIMVYRHSTGFEALIGYLYLKEDWDRLDELLTKIIDQRKKDEENEIRGNIW